jgi:phospho-N-acetylmuramoyl-pentapeptide-transferase
LVIPFLKRLKARQSIREEGPQSHQVKAGTPTMGGIMIITAVLLGTLIGSGLSTASLNCLLAMTAFGGIGFLDDYLKVVKKQNMGLRARGKLGLQLLVGLVFAYVLLVYLHRGTELIVPFSGLRLDIGWFYIPLLVVVFIGASNAVNLTDGLDGLAAGVTAIVGAGYWLITVMTGHLTLSPFTASMIGACLAFLVFNRHPARVFMGDTGSMALGGAVAALAVATRTEIVLILVGGVYVLEALSVMIQVISFKTTGKRVFLMAPLHHHYELKGWKETRVVWLFWLWAAVFVLVGILSLHNAG